MQRLFGDLVKTRANILDQFKYGISKHLTLVLGNESCDLDSVASSIAFAAFLQAHSKNDSLVSAVLSIPRQELRLHTEVKFWLKHLFFPADSNSSSEELLNGLLFIDELHKDKIEGSRSKVDIRLVDHNVLSQSLVWLKPFVTEIIDHHKIDFEPGYWAGNLRKRIVTPVGSCASLVAERLLLEWPQMPTVIGELLLGAIILDTEDLGNWKTKNIDRIAVADLQDKLGSPFNWPMYSTNICKKLILAKVDVSELTGHEILLKDFKMVPGGRGNGGPKIGMSTVHTNFAKLVEKCGQKLEETLENFCESRSIEALIGINYDSVAKLFIHSKDATLLHEIYQILKNLPDESQVFVKELTSYNFTSTKVYSCGALSRKILMPFIRQHFESTGDKQ